MKFFDCKTSNFFVIFAILCVPGETCFGCAGLFDYGCCGGGLGGLGGGIGGYGGGIGGYGGGMGYGGGIGYGGGMGYGGLGGYGMGYGLGYGLGGICCGGMGGYGGGFIGKRDTESEHKLIPHETSESPES